MTSLTNFSSSTSSTTSTQKTTKDKQRRPSLGDAVIFNSTEPIFADKPAGLPRSRSISIYTNNPYDIMPLRVPPIIPPPSPSSTSPIPETIAKKKNAAVYDNVRRIIKELCPLMTGVRIEDIEIKNLGGGLTNVLYVATGREGKKPSSIDNAEDSDPGEETFPVQCLVRVNGDGDALIDREIENRVAAMLSENSIAPKYFGRFINGRVEEFYPCAYPLDPGRMHPSEEQMENPESVLSYCYTISTAMCHIHKLIVKDGVSKTDNNEGQVWKQTDLWITKAEGLMETVPGLKGLVEEAFGEQGGFEYVKSEWGRVKNMLGGPPPAKAKDEDGTPCAVDFSRAIIFAHMDCQSLNILSSDLWSSPYSIKLIDYEYAGHNPRALDIANTFCEFCTMNDLTADFIKEYPTDAEGYFYLNRYITEGYPALKAHMLQTAGQEGYDQFIKDFRFSVDQHAMVSHLAWVLWSVIQRGVSDIDYDFLKYGSMRLKGYEFSKDRVSF